MDLNKYFKGLEGDVNMEIKIKYFNDAKELEINPKGNCIDVYANEDIFIPFMGYAMIPLGFALNLPKGMTGRLMPRSSTFKSWGCIETNSVGMIDDTYVGNDDQWFLPLQCTMAKVTEKVVIEGKKVTFKAKSGENALEQFQKALDNIMPNLEVKSVRRGGSNYQVPMEVRPERRQTLGLRWLTTYSRNRNEKTMRERLAAEIIDATNSTGGAFKKREDTHKMAEANKAFAHYRY